MGFGIWLKHHGKNWKLTEKIENSRGAEVRFLWWIFLAVKELFFFQTDLYSIWIKTNKIEHIEMCLQQNLQDLQKSICLFDYFIDNHIIILLTII